MNTRLGRTTAARVTIPSGFKATAPIGVCIPKVCIERVRSSAPNGPGSGRSPTHRSLFLVNSKIGPDDQSALSSLKGVRCGASGVTGKALARRDTI
jgi:hypothetical protein